MWDVLGLIERVNVGLLLTEYSAVGLNFDVP